MRTKTNNKATGDKGEAIVCKYLQRKGWKIIDRNYQQRWFEIDIIAQFQQTIHFIEVKTVSYETIKDLNKAVTRETWRPEEQVHAKKLEKIGRGVDFWLSSTKYEGKWQFDVAAVRIVPRETYATVKYIDNLVL